MLIDFRPVLMSFVEASIAVALVQMRHLTAATAKRGQLFCLAAVCTSFFSFSHDSCHQLACNAWLTIDFFWLTTDLRLYPALRQL